MQSSLHGYWSFLFSLFVATVLGACSSTRDIPLAITHVTLIDATGAPPRADVTVIVARGMISSIGPSSSIAIPPGARVIDGSGKFLIPGLADMHVHLTGAGEPNGSREFILPLLVANGITTVRDMGGSVELLKTLRAEVDSGKRVGPHIFFTGPYLDGNPPSFQPSVVVQNAAEGKAAVDQLKRDGVDFVKVQSRLQPEAYFAIASEAKQQGMRFVGHVPDSITAAQASDAGQASLEHLTGVLLGMSEKENELRNEKMKPPVAGESREVTRNRDRLWTQTLLDSLSAQKTAVLLATFAKNRTWNVPTFPTLVHIGFVTPQTDLARDPRLKYVPSSVQANWQKATREQLEGYSSEDFILREAIVRHSMDAVGKMNAAGIPLMAGTDTAAPNVIPGFSLHEDLGYLVRSGLTPMQALQAATVEPAEFLGKGAEQGTIEIGKRADLVLLDANPLDDIRNTQKIRAVVVNATALDRGKLDKLLSSVGRFAATH